MATSVPTIVPSAVKAAEGSYRPGPYVLSDGWLSATAGRFWNFWQMGYSVQPYGQSGAMVEACVSAYAQTVAMCPGDHWESQENGGRKRITNSALSRIIRRPNDYQSMSDLLLNLTRRVYTNGETFGIAIRNSRNEISELHWMRNGWPVVASDGSIFYNLQGNEIVEARFDLSLPIPARDVLHVRLHTPRHPLKGESPICAAALELMMSGAALNHQVAFYINQARPSFLLETEAQLSKPQADELRQRWDEQTKGENSGGTPILSWGLKAKPVTVGAGDAQLADMLKLSDQNVALAFRMPLQILGIGGTPFASTEALMSSWKAMGLGFVLNHIEEAFGLLFRLRGYPDEYLELDTNALLRSSFKDMIDALSNGTRRLMTLDEARGFIDLPTVKGGDEILVQEQDIPLSMAGKKNGDVGSVNFESLKLAFDAYGVGVRAGAITPQVSDEKEFRKLAGFPAPSDDVVGVWESEPIRRPITLKSALDDPALAASSTVDEDAADDEKNESERSPYDELMIAKIASEKFELLWDSSELA